MDICLVSKLEYVESGVCIIIHHYQIFLSSIHWCQHNSIRFPTNWLQQIIDRHYNKCIKNVGNLMRKTWISRSTFTSLQLYLLKVCAFGAYVILYIYEVTWRRCQLDELMVNHIKNSSFISELLQQDDGKIDLKRDGLNRDLSSKYKMTGNTYNVRLGTLVLARLT